MVFLIALFGHEAEDRDKWLLAIRDFLSFEMPTHESLTALIEKIEIGKNEGTRARKVQSVKIFYRFVGCVD